MDKHLLSVHKMTKSFKQGDSIFTILDTISVTFEQGKSYAIRGISGSGKSTLLHIIAGLENPTSGKVLYDTSDIVSFTQQQKAYFLNTSVGLVFQSPYLIRELSILENIMLPGLIAGKTTLECSEKGTMLLTQVGLLDKKDHQLGALSGGQQQRVALARALFNEPAFLLADEPTGNLDIHTGLLIIDLIVHLQKQWNMGLIISTHDDYVADRLEKRYEIKQGSLLEI